MKNLFSMLVILFILYFGIQLAFTFFSKSNDLTYELTKDDMTLKVEENVIYKVQNNINNYYFKVSVNDIDFSFQVLAEFKRGKQSIIAIDYFISPKYTCIFPIFEDNKIIIDALCYDNEKFLSATTLNNTDVNNHFSTNEFYNRTNWLDNPSEQTGTSDVTIYGSNIVNGHYVGISNYVGGYIMSKEISNKLLKDFKLFNSDVYNHSLGAFIGKYYIIADYNQQYSFNDFLVYDIETLKGIQVSYHTKISFDSYVQGIVDNKLYIYDKENGKQYEIDPERSTVIEYGNNGDGINYYKNGSWEKMTVAEAKAETKFSDHTDYEDNNYVKIDKVGNEYGYYYLYKKNGSKYSVYRINIQDKAGLTYLFEIDNINNVVYIDNYIYFTIGNQIKYFNETTGVRTLASYKEIEFNKNLHFGVYVD